jgi:hypothetical protein
VGGEGLANAPSRMFGSEELILLTRREKSP